ncbi:MAG: YciI family protein [Flammeovirgaceae bacterium]|nr:YciI family protein [Flammeovirgaceae bacterium]
MAEAMKWIGSILFIFLLIGIAINVSFAQKNTNEENKVTTPQSQLSHYIVIFRFQRQTFEQDATEEEAKTVKTHLQYLKDLHADDRILFAGFRKDAVDGIVIFEAPTCEAAIKIVENDPAVKSRLFAWELHDFQTVLIHRVKP